MPTPPRTARGLVATLAPFRPWVDRAALGFDLDLPQELESLLSVLHTGVRALLTGRKWFGCGSEQAMAAPRPLNPDAPIPARITLLCAEGDAKWDRIDLAAWADIPELFAR